MESPPVTIVHHESEFGEWESVRRDPDPRLRLYVRSYEGYVETRANFSTRMEVPSTDAVMIINLGPPYRVHGPGNARGAGEYGSFVAGMIDAHVLVEATGLACGLQVNFTPIGAGAVFGMPMDEVTNRTVALADVFGGDASRLEAQLDDTPDWQSRFAILDVLLARRIAAAPLPPPALAFAMDRISRSGGRADIQRLAAEVGWSRKHLSTQFRRHIGLPPKTMARVVRFNRVIRMLNEDAGARWTDVALRCGYYDQAHFNRDFREFTGGTPSAYLGRRIPDDGGLVGD